MPAITLIQSKSVRLLAKVSVSDEGYQTLQHIQRVFHLEDGSLRADKQTDGKRFDIRQWTV